MNELDFLGTALGLLYLILEIRENHWMWVVGSIMPLIYIFVLFDKGLYADCGMEVYYFLAGIYGLLYWLRHRTGQGATQRPLPISVTPTRLRLPLLLLALLLWVLLALFLLHATDSTVPWLDALTTALSIIGLWMLSRKYIEQWWVWFIVDAISVGLYLYKGIYGRALLYTIYTLMVYFGYRQWQRRMRQQAPNVDLEG
ncbi:MAG: nicotinamide mononucleotide transporter [Bacteroidaceae bacterium]|nr:nicotinamide mononucleotide transporter [Bacteroidaceae bacterium]